MSLTCRSRLTRRNPKVIEAALRVTNGRVVINSVSGEREHVDSIFPLAKHYGAAVLGLAMDERGLPETAAQRVAIAEHIVAEAEKYGLDTGTSSSTGTALPSRHSGAGDGEPCAQCARL